MENMTVWLVVVCMRMECLIWHVDFVGKRVSRETLGDGG